MPEIELSPTNESRGSSREVWHEQLITPPKSDVAALDEPNVAFDPSLRFIKVERREYTFRPINIEETAISR